ncbi:hypothetical protein BDE02_06G163800 [Populus trichocarpa]|nr:hypothetical protein BDE02_06G163800 [Populus trichocarpa]
MLDTSLTSLHSTNVPSTPSLPFLFSLHLHHHLSLSDNLLFNIAILSPLPPIPQPFSGQTPNPGFTCSSICISVFANGEY